jgi:hypothetical protein
VNRCCGGPSRATVPRDTSITLLVRADADIGCEVTLADVLADPDTSYGITFTPDLDVVGIECVGIT